MALKILRYFQSFLAVLFACRFCQNGSNHLILLIFIGLIESYWKTQKRASKQIFRLVRYSKARCACAMRIFPARLSAVIGPTL
jgi:hypothetical protein